MNFLEDQVKSKVKSPRLGRSTRTKKSMAPKDTQVASRKVRSSLARGGGGGANPPRYLRGNLAVQPLGGIPRGKKGTRCHKRRGSRKKDFKEMGDYGKISYHCILLKSAPSLGRNIPRFNSEEEGKRTLRVMGKLLVARRFDMGGKEKLKSRKKTREHPTLG